MEYAEVLDWLYAQLPMFQRTGPVRYRIDLDKTHALCARPRTSGVRAQRGAHRGDQRKGFGEPCCVRGASGPGPHGGPVHFPAPGGPRERIRINGEWISREAFVAFVVDHMAVWEELQPSFFELMFTMALSAFQSTRGGPVVLETGMGGRLDSTNIFPGAPRDGDHLDRSGSPAIPRARPALHRRREGRYPPRKGCRACSGFCPRRPFRRPRAVDEVGGGGPRWPARIRRDNRT